MAIVILWNHVAPCAGSRNFFATMFNVLHHFFSASLGKAKSAGLGVLECWEEWGPQRDFELQYSSTPLLHYSNK
ncbi:MAG: hypothetical protein AMJ70_07350 [Dehalococcoidia bacterium SG8_51_3]|nr:MAG: hypothetical protein AMJ70_07350 [Dehalococcoidia bacterium SG8_51_3]